MSVSVVVPVVMSMPVVVPVVVSASGDASWCQCLWWYVLVVFSSRVCQY